MVSLYKDPDGAKVFAAHDQTLVTKTLSQSLREVETAGSGNTTSSISALQQRIRELEDELTTRGVYMSVVSQCNLIQVSVSVMHLKYRWNERLNHWVSTTIISVASDKENEIA